MANHCWNSIQITDVTKEQVERIDNWLESYNDFNTVNDWVKSIITLTYTKAPKRNLMPLKPKDLDDSYRFGGRWFELQHNEYGDDFYFFSGDSAWSPMIGMCQALSTEFKCKVEIEYDESGMDFGGERHFNNGVEKVLYDGTSNGFAYYAGGVSRLLEVTEYIDSTEEYEILLDDVRKFIKNPTHLMEFRDAFREFDIELVTDEALAKFIGK